LKTLFFYSQIAAKIQPNQQGQKRSIEDSLDSESKKFGGSDYGSNASSPNAMSPAAMQMQAAAQAAAAQGNYLLSVLK
jgi:hypothetical protein